MLREIEKRIFLLDARVKGIGATAKYAAKQSGPLEDAVFNEGDVLFPYEMTSPDGRLRAFLGRKEVLSYSVFLKAEQVITESNIGLVIKGVDIGRDILVGEPIISLIDETYSNRGNSKQARDCRNSYVFPVRHLQTGLEYHIEVAVWNDGFGFRLLFRPGMRFLVNDESTTFRLPVDSVCWYQTDTKKLQGKTLCQQTRYLPQNVRFSCLTAFELHERKGYVLITEANLKNYPGAALLSKGGGELKVDLWDSDDFYVEGCTTPWRLVIVCQTLNELANSNVIKNAAEPALGQLENADWIVPGKSAWSYFINEPVSREFETIMLYNNSAYEMGLPYSIIDAGWRRWGITEGMALRKVAKVVEDGRIKGVKIFLWKSVRSGPMFALYRKRFLKKCRKIGVVGIKLDHIESETQFMIRLYRRFLEDAAENQLMVLYHNPQKPTGLSRTYPNLMSMEAIRGMQCCCDPDDTTVLPFTRLVAGDADYTPLCFTVPARRRDASLSHMLATTVIMTSSFMTLGEDPHVLSQQVFADFIRELPTVWDETIVLPQSVLGDVALFARRSGDSWYLAALNSLKGKRELTIKLDFLSDDSTYNLELFFDDMEKQLEVKRLLGPSKSTDAIRISMRSGGGFAGKFSVIQDNTSEGNAQSGATKI